MMRRRGPSPRRAFLGAALAAAGTAAISCGRGGPGRTFRFFTDDQAALVDAVCETLIPSDGSPGAHAARVVNYIDIQLTRHFRKHRQAYREGIAAIQSTSRDKFSKPFPELPPDDRTAVLSEIEEKHRAFFDLILTHARQGFYGDPRHGGNYEMASWKMVGLPFPPVRGRMRYDAEPKAL
jgi:gluconate 2-dehydrogenase gamma chain